MAKGNPTGDPGAHVGRALVDLVSEAVVKIRAGLIPVENAERWKGNTAAIKGMEAELAPFVSAMFGELLTRDELPDGMRAMLGEAIEPSHPIALILELV